MLPTIDHKLAFPDSDDMELWADLDALFAEQPRISLGAAQFALLFLADVALERHWELQDQLLSSFTSIIAFCLFGNKLGVCSFSCCGLGLLATTNYLTFLSIPVVWR
jgi:hypothetical protein